MLDGERVNSLRWLPIAVGLFVAATAVPLASSRDALIFFITLFVYVPLLAIAASISTVWLAVERRSSHRRSIACVLVAIFAAVPLFYIGNSLRDPIRFAFWYPFHAPLLGRYSARDGIVAHWDAWGIAGLENDAYLVADHGPALSSNGAATAWLKRRGGTCDIVNVERLLPSLYILTTFECGL